jgi:tetratricopeptide (TPR) repeat protein
MIAKYPNSAALRFRYLTCLGKWAEVYGIFAAAKEGVADLMKEHSEKIIELDPEYENGGGYFMLGAVHFKSPYIPFILSWPDNDDAIIWLRKAFQTGVAIPVQKTYLAKALYKDKQEDEAIRLVREVISTPPDPDYLVEERYEIEEAKALLEDFE